MPVYYFGGEYTKNSWIVETEAPFYQNRGSNWGKQRLCLGEEVQEWLDKQLRRYQNDGFGLWGMIEKDSGELIGQCGLTYQEFNGQQVPEIGYLLRAEYWHKGYATEAAIACKEYAFNILNFDKVYSIIRDTNIPSQKVALRNDMREIANFIKHYRNIDMLHLVFCVNKL